MTKFYQSKSNQTVYKLINTVGKTVYLQDASNTIKTVTVNTLNRYYQEVQPVQPTRKPLPPADVIRELTQKRTKQPKQTEQSKQPVANKTNKYSYYRHYKRNQKPLWNTQTIDNAFYCCAEDGTQIIKCTLSKTAICIRIEQVATKAKRYFTNFNRAKRHLVYDQDIKTTQYINEKFDKWLKAQQKRIIEGGE